MNITLKKLKELNACTESRDAFIRHGKKSIEVNRCFDLLIFENKLDWENWLISRLLNKKNKIKYAIFAAEQVIEIYEKKYPNDNRPRNAIESAKKYLKKPTKANAYAAADAAAAYAAADAAYAAADAAAYAAYAVAYAAYAAYDAYDAAAYAAAAAAYDAADAADAKKEMKIRIIKYGITLLKPGIKK